MRLTEKDKQENHYFIKPINTNTAFDFEARIKADDKLGQLEDIEDELGIDLNTFAKILKQGFYYKDGFGNIEHFNKQMIDLVILPKIKELGNDFKDYGKTWALTKEELEK